MRIEGIHHMEENVNSFMRGLFYELPLMKFEEFMLASSIVKMLCQWE